MKLILLILLSLIPSTYAFNFPHMTVPELIRYWGYGCEIHDVTTRDGYILSMHRITKVKSGANNTKFVVFMQHGLMSSSSTFAYGPPKKSLGYILTDAGFDVWLANSRGNRYSRRHLRYNPDVDTKIYWDFGWEEFALLDIPAELDLIREITGQDKLFFVGHSQGSTLYYVLLSQLTDYNDKILMGVTMAPTVFMGNATHPLMTLARSAEDIQSKLHSWDHFEVGGQSYMYHLLGKYLCTERNPIGMFVCTIVSKKVMGLNLEQVNTSMTQIYLDNKPDSSSLRPWVHFEQLHLSGRFAKYDYGPETNMRMYGNLTPPDYNVSKVTAPTLVFYGDQDNVAAPADVIRLCSLLPHLLGCFKANHTGWTHADFEIGKDADTAVFRIVAEAIRMRAESLVPKRNE